MQDVLIVGGGVIGASIALQLSRFRLNLSLLEKEEEIASTIKSSTIATIHDGYTQPYNLLKTRLCFQGRDAFPQLARVLDFKYKQTGSLVLAHNETEKKELLALLKNGEKIGLEDLELWNRQLILKQIPKISPSVKYALYSKGTGVCCPSSLIKSMMKSAVENGMDLLLNQEVINIESFSHGYRVMTNQGKTYLTRYLINAAGAEASHIDTLVRSCHPSPTLPLYLRPSKTAVHNSPLEQILLNCSKMGNCKKILLPANTHDFIVEQPRKLPHYVHISGVSLLGVTAAPAIAHRVTGILTDTGLKLEAKDYNKPPLKKVTPNASLGSARKKATITTLPLNSIRDVIPNAQDKIPLAMVTLFSSLVGKRENDFSPLASWQEEDSQSIPKSENSFNELGDRLV